MNTIKVRTTQNVEVEYAIASVGDRILAYLVDGAVLVGWFILIGIVASTFTFLESAGEAILIFLLFLPVPFYHLCSEIFMNGQSLGKRALDIKVVKMSGHSPSVGDYLLRWILRIIDSGIVAVITIAINGKGQRLGDLAAGTTVIKTHMVRRRRPFQVKIEDDYQIQFPEVTQLTDKDMALMRQLLYKAIEHRNEVLLERIAQRAKEVMGVETNLTDREFLKTVIKDYQHAMAGVEAEA
ncbi:RDD family protein [Rufibacter roseus]|uniref:RDD family protein n=1 Tax=Rufibacter roseus TaxID=1567108 RepID=A0ABW2DL29_9BACT|nr:RDD family protein [Rufibacter roseus]